MGVEGVCGGGRGGVYDWAGQLPCQLVDRQSAVQGSRLACSRHFASPGSLMRDRRHRRGPTDTWVTLKESVPHLAPLFHFSPLMVSLDIFKMSFLHWQRMSG